MATPLSAKPLITRTWAFTFKSVLNVTPLNVTPLPVTVSFAPPTELTVPPPIVHPTRFHEVVLSLIVNVLKKLLQEGPKKFTDPLGFVMLPTSLE